MIEYAKIKELSIIHHFFVDFQAKRGHLCLMHRFKGTSMKFFDVYDRLMFQ